MTTTEYWFARRFPLGNPRSAIGPVHWKGWLLTLAFVALMTAAGVAFAWFGANGNMMEGIAIFIIVAFIGGIAFMSMANSKCDKIRTVADYKKDRQRA